METSDKIRSVNSKEKDMSSHKLFDIVIGNPPYHMEQVSKNFKESKKNYEPPVYNDFIDGSISVANQVELIHPARFLFNAGKTPKSWNYKMLHDKHFKVLEYFNDSNKVFPTLETPIKGGIAITYWNQDRNYGPIETFSPYREMASIINKVKKSPSFHSLARIVYSRTSYGLTSQFHHDYPHARKQLSKGHAFDMSSNIFERIPEAFYVKKPQDNQDYAEIIGRIGNKGGIKRFIKREYISVPDNFDFYKIFMPQATGSGSFGEKIHDPLVEGPNIGATETYITLGKFNNKVDAEHLAKYIKTKFLRVLLSALKVTQNGNREVWSLIPLQNFTSNSDINWNLSISQLDKELYRKYRFDPSEIQFIESHVKEMA